LASSGSSHQPQNSLNRAQFQKSKRFVCKLCTCTIETFISFTVGEEADQNIALGPLFNGFVQDDIVTWVFFAAVSKVWRKEIQRKRNLPNLTWVNSPNAIIRFISSRIGLPSTAAIGIQATSSSLCKNRWQTSPFLSMAHSPMANFLPFDLSCRPKPDCAIVTARLPGGSNTNYTPKFRRRRTDNMQDSDSRQLSCVESITVEGGRLRAWFSSGSHAIMRLCEGTAF
jgi:hypothetical protein